MRQCVPGQVTLRPLPASNRFRAIGDIMVVVQAGDILDVQLPVAEAQEILISVVDNRAMPIPGALVTLFEPGGTGADQERGRLLERRRTNEDGCCSFWVSHPSVCVAIESRGHLPGWIEGVSAQDGIVDVVLRLGGSIEVTLEVADTQGFFLQASSNHGKVLQPIRRSVTEIPGLVEGAWHIDLMYLDQTLGSLGTAYVVPGETQHVSRATTYCGLVPVRGVAMSGSRVLAGARITAWLTGHCPWKTVGLGPAVADAEGSFELAVPAGCVAHFGALTVSDEQDVVGYAQEISIARSATQAGVLEFSAINACYRVLKNSQLARNTPVILSAPCGEEQELRTDGGGRLCVRGPQVAPYGCRVRLKGGAASKLINPRADMWLAEERSLSF